MPTHSQHHPYTRPRAYKTKPADPTLIPYPLGDPAKTVVWAKPGLDVEELRRRFVNKHKTLQ